MSRPEPFCRLQFDETLSGYLGRLAMKLGLDLADRDVHPGLKKRLEELGYKKDIHPIALAAHFSGVSSQVVSEFHTVLPFLEALSEKRSRLFSEIPIPTNVKSGIELGHIFPAKVCPACVRRDLRKLGSSYWRRSHQVPGLVVCTRHWERLQLAKSRHSYYLQPHHCLADSHEVSDEVVSEFHARSALIWLRLLATRKTNDSHAVRQLISEVYTVTKDRFSQELCEHIRLVSNRSYEELTLLSKETEKKTRQFFESRVLVEALAASKISIQAIFATLSFYS